MALPLRQLRMDREDLFMKLAILGTGFIVKEGAQPSLREVPEVEVTAIFARAKSKSVAEGLAVQYSIPKVYTDYDDFRIAFFRPK